MAGTITGRDFDEKIPTFLKQKMDALAASQGIDSRAYRGFCLQYVKDEREKIVASEENAKHYEAAMDVVVNSSESMKGVERLYRRCVVIETTMVCAAHCRYCLRANYNIFTLTEEELIAIAKYIGSGSIGNEVREVLITGGDPLIIPRKLDTLLEALVEYAPNVKVARIATRLLTQDPSRIDSNVFNAFRSRPGLRLELATQINQPEEFFPETIEKLLRFSELGVRIYSQNVLLRGVNDDLDTLIELYDTMRLYNIEAHYLFHAIPLKGTHHLRPSVAKGLELARALTASGNITGRSKPMFALMTEIGKITLYDGAILDRNDRNEILVQSEYRYDDRIRWNPAWSLPRTGEIGNDGRLRIWYLDGKDKD